MKSFKITQSITDRQDASLGLFFKEVSRIPLITTEEEKELCKRIKEGDIKAVNKLVESNLRFVISVAKKYQNKGLPLVDLIQYGVLGCREAALKWDSDKGFKFISYAVWWIRQSIIQALSLESRTVRVPMNQIVNMNKISKASEKLEKELHRNPAIEEIEQEIELPSSKINLTLSSINKAVSLDTPFKSDEEAGCLLDVIPNKNSISSDRTLIEESVSKEINDIIDNLTIREGDIIRMYFGLGIEEMTLEEIACRFGIGAERARQICNEAISKLKTDYIEEFKKLL